MKSTIYPHYSLVYNIHTYPNEEVITYSSKLNAAECYNCCASKAIVNLLSIDFILIIAVRINIMILVTAALLAST